MRRDGVLRGEAHHAAAGAAVLSLVRSLLVVERGLDADGAAGLDLATLVPPAWRGQSWEVHAAPTAYGRVGYAVRWHGNRPALIWELVPHDPQEQPRLRAPGLDPSWSTTQLRGEALLAPLSRSTAESTR